MNKPDMCVMFRLYYFQDKREIVGAKNTEKVDKLFKGKTREERRELARKMWSLMEQFKQDVNEKIIADFADDMEGPS